MKRKIDTERSNKLGEEELFQDYFYGNYEQALPRCVLIAREFPLYPAYSILRGERSNTIGGFMGKIDFIFRYKEKTYIAEVKYSPFTSSEFWDATKVMAYTEYYKWQEEYNQVYPAVMIPAQKIKLEHQIVAGKLGITIFLISKLEDGRYKVKMLDDRPYWRQQQENEPQ